MKYLKMILVNPWIILITILLFFNLYNGYANEFNFSSFTGGLLLTTLTYALMDKLRDSILKDQLEKLDRMSRASSVVLYDGKGKEVLEDNEEYTRGFREAASIIIKDLKL